MEYGVLSSAYNDVVRSPVFELGSVNKPFSGSRGYDLQVYSVRYSVYILRSIAGYSVHGLVFQVFLARVTRVTDGNMDRPRLVGYPFLEATVHILWRSSYEPAIYRKTHSVVVDLEDLQLGIFFSTDVIDPNTLYAP